MRATILSILGASILDPKALFVASFTNPTMNNNQRQLQKQSTTPISLSKSGDYIRSMENQRIHELGPILASAVLVSTLALTSPIAAFADEYGVEKEAPTLFTGETVQICTKRGPLGACLKTELRTADNDNDKSEKYFMGGSTNDLAKRKEEEMRQVKGEGNELIEKLMKQSEDNREKNELSVKIKTALNDQGANFGPFDRQVVILNEDGKGFTLLENPQAMRLKKAGFINNNKQFVKQPTEQELEDALVSEEPGFFQGLFGGDKDPLLE